jgi:hypothetical protein
MPVPAIQAPTAEQQRLIQELEAGRVQMGSASFVSRFDNFTGFHASNTAGTVTMLVCDSRTMRFYQLRIPINYQAGNSVELREVSPITQQRGIERPGQIPSSAPQDSVSGRSVSREGTAYRQELEIRIESPTLQWPRLAAFRIRASFNVGISFSTPDPEQEIILRSVLSNGRLQSDIQARLHTMIEGLVIGSRIPIDIPDAMVRAANYTRGDGNFPLGELLTATYRNPALNVQIQLQSDPDFPLRLDYDPAIAMLRLPQGRITLRAMVRPNVFRDINVTLPARIRVSLFIGPNWIEIFRRIQARVGSFASARSLFTNFLRGMLSPSTYISILSRLGPNLGIAAFATVIALALDAGLLSILRSQRDEGARVGLRNQYASGLIRELFGRPGDSVQSSSANSQQQRQFRDAGIAEARSRISRHGGDRRSAQADLLRTLYPNGAPPSNVMNIEVLVSQVQSNPAWHN